MLESQGQPDGLAGKGACNQVRIQSLSPHSRPKTHSWKLLADLHMYAMTHNSHLSPIDKY